MERKSVLIVDFGGGNVNELAAVVRKQHVFCEILSPEAALLRLERTEPQAVITFVGAGKEPGQELLTADVPALIVRSGGENFSGVKNVRGKLYEMNLGSKAPSSAGSEEALRYFLFEITGLEADWDLGQFIDEQVREIRERVGDRHVICGLSGGVDSSVAAAIVHKAIGDQLTCVFVNHGLLRKNEAEGVRQLFGETMGMKLVYADVSERFLGKLKGVVDPERKRKIIGEEFIRVFEEEAARVGDAAFLVQGTIYPDIVESGTAGGALVKSHHNVGGLPEDMTLELIEPLRLLFKEEVREVGRFLGLPEAVVGRHPFPGPGLAIRIIGEVSPERVRILQEADYIFIDEIRRAGLYGKIWQAFAVLTGVKSVGVHHDRRTYAEVVALRAVLSHDAMTADWAELPYDLLARVSARITAEVEGINRVVYDITAKPPGTVEWE